MISKTMKQRILELGKRGKTVKEITQIINNEFETNEPQKNVRIHYNIFKKQGKFKKHTKLLPAIEDKITVCLEKNYPFSATTAVINELFDRNFTAVELKNYYEEIMKPRPVRLKPEDKLDKLIKMVGNLDKQINELREIWK